MAAPRYPKLRTDLTWRRFSAEGEDFYVFKDDITQQYVKLDEITGGIALRMDGTTSPEELLAWTEQQWPGLAFDLDYIADVIADMKRYKFVEDPFQRNALLRAKAHEERAQINASTFRNLMSIPFGTVNPDRFLDRTYPYIRWFFTPPFVALGLVVFLTSLYVVVLNRDHLGSQAMTLVPGLGMSPLVAALMWVTVIVAVIIHEMGHAYAIKHYGGKVHKLGFMSMLIFPCMFCDTSDSHLFPNWKHRAYVALSGTYTELYVASFATLVWWATPSASVINQLAYNIMVFSSVSGILFNYNPLIKLDGYFVLADMLDMPDLQENAFEYMGWLFQYHVLRRRDLPCPAEGRRRKRVLATYGALSLAYSVFFGGLAIVIVRALLIQNFAFVGALIGAAIVGVILWKVGGFFARAGRGWALNHRGLIRRHQLPVLAGLALLLVLLLLVPVAGRRGFTVSLQPVRKAALVAPEELRLEQAGWSAGQRVAEGELLAVLDADLAMAERGEANAAAGALRIRSATARRSGEAHDAVAAQAGEAAARERSQVLERRVERAELRAPFAGRVLTASEPGRLGECFEAGDTVCTVGDFSEVRAEGRLTESDLEDVHTGAPVRIRLRAHPSRVLRGRVSVIEPAAEHAQGRRLYRVRIRLDDPPRDARAGLTGQAWIATPARTPASHFIRFLARFVRLDLWV